MKNLVNTTAIRPTNFIKNNTITAVRFISKCRAGFMTISDARDFDLKMYNEHPESLITGFKKGALQTVEVQLDGSKYWLTVFARNGKKIPVIDEVILQNLTVGTINQYFYNTELYGQTQYAAVGAKTWADRAYVSNVIAGVDFSDSLKALEDLTI